LKNLNVSKNVNLTCLSCFDNPLKALDLSKNRKLDTLYAFYTDIETIDIGNCPLLQKRLKLDHKTQDDVIMWGRDEEDGYKDYLDIDVDTRLTAGKKVLYPGK
jgi:hypothetical protein